MSLPNLNSNNEENKKRKPSLPAFDMPSVEETPEEDVQFEKVPLESVLEDKYDENLNNNIYEDEEDFEEPSELPIMNNDYDDGYFVEEDDYNPDYEEDLEREKESKFVDKKKKRLIPFGGKKSKRKIKSSEFDKRKNVLAKTKVLRAIIMSVIVVLFFVGLKNTFLPNHVYTSEQIKQFAREGSGQTGFPEERGRAFVESFMESYLTFDRTRPELIEIVGHYYGEDYASRVSNEQLNMRVGIDATQHIIISPKVYDIILFEKTSAQYKVSAYVSNTDGSEVRDRRSAGRWLSFSVNVFYNVEADALAITPDSPSLIPPYRINTQAVVPDRYPLGNGEVNNDIAPTLNPTINGFVKAYAEASISSHESILQYVDDKNDIKLYDGFGGAVALNGSPSSAIKKVIYNSDDGIYRVDLTVNWVDMVASRGDNVVEYTARYIMRVTPIGNGKYAVSSFVPYTYYAK